MRPQIYLTIAAISSAFGHSALAQDTRPYLTIDAAKAGAQSCQAYAEDNDLRVAISIKDRGGRLVYFQRMDDVFQKQAELSHIKAETAATTPLSTKALSEVVMRSGSPLIAFEALPGITLVEGGEPIRLKSGEAIGGVGVSGAPASEDGICARMAVDAIVEKLSK